MLIEGNEKEKAAMEQFHAGNRAEGLRLQEEFAREFRIEYAHQEHVPNCMRPMINAKIRLLSELTEHTIANEIEAPHEILRK